MSFDVISFGIGYVLGIATVVIVAVVRDPETWKKPPKK